MKKSADFWRYSEYVQINPAALRLAGLDLYIFIYRRVHIGSPAKRSAAGNAQASSNVLPK
ncbi:hypothetical protein [Kluyvera intermedia]|uniref:hypothetical protein n=1 Tax=Kluyvera intermedia TaxID=61648 RepID=UPI0039F5E3B1